jgi:hypothetical protein
MQSISRRHALAGLAAAAVAAAVPTLALAAADNDPKTVFTRYNDEVVNGGNLDAIDELFTEDYAPQLADPGDLPGRDALKQRMATNIAARRQMMPDAVLLTDTLIAEGDTVAARQRWSGVNIGDVNELVVLTIVTIRAGQIAWLWTLEDNPWLRAT